MKMVKSLLLGTAAGLVAVAGAQAADMPVKAKPVLYVKICSLYGDGFYYIPGTDICLKLGGYVRDQHYYNYGDERDADAVLLHAELSGQRQRRHRQTRLCPPHPVADLGRYPSADRVGHLADLLHGRSHRRLRRPPQAIYANRGFIQFAGFTLGLASSFFDFYSSPIVTYFATNSEDTGDGGWRVAAYTANFGNGFTATVSLEEPRRRASSTPPRVALTGAVSSTPPAPPRCRPPTATRSWSAAVPLVADQATIRYPDIVMNWRVDQAWGAAMIGGADPRRQRRLLRQHA